MVNKEKLFGFRLADSSALLMFVFALLLMLLSLDLMFMVVLDYGEDGDVIPPDLILTLAIIMTIGIYILYKTLKYRRK